MFKSKGDPEAQAAHGAKGNPYNFIVVFFAALGSFTYGYSSSIIGSIFGLPGFWSYFDLSLTGPRANRTNDMIGAANGLFAGGGMIGALIIPPALNRLGRKLTIQIACTTCVIACAIQGGSVHIGMVSAPNNIRVEGHC
jgi:MFS family permease